MSPSRALRTVELEQVTRFWLHRQGLSRPRGAQPLSRQSFSDHLERTGALQLDSINVVERAHYLTLWSRFGFFDRELVDRLSYDRTVAYEYWGHEASLLPIAHLPLGRRRMRRFPGEWADRAWWKTFATPVASKRRVLRRLRNEGPLKSVDFTRQPQESSSTGYFGSDLPLPKQDKRSLQLLWHDGRVAVAKRRHFRRVYDLAERVYPESPIASVAEFEDSWLLQGLSGCGVAPLRHLQHYITGPSLKQKERLRAVARQQKLGRIEAVNVRGLPGPCFALVEHLDRLVEAPEACGTTLICPFDSLLWQRQRAEDLLNFRYRVEIYIPQKKREFGYYVLPILHDGRLVGRLDPKLHRERGELEIKAVFLEPGVTLGGALLPGLRQAIQDLAHFVGAVSVSLPKGWGQLE